MSRKEQLRPHVPVLDRIQHKCRTLLWAPSSKKHTWQPGKSVMLIPLLSLIRFMTWLAHLHAHRHDIGIRASPCFCLDVESTLKVRGTKSVGCSMSKSKSTPPNAGTDLKSGGPIWGPLLYIQWLHGALDSRFAAASLRWHLQKQGAASRGATIEPARTSPDCDTCHERSLVVITCKTKPQWSSMIHKLPSGNLP